MFTVEGISSPECLLWKAYLLQNVYCGRHIFSRMFTVEGISSPEYLLWKAYFLQNTYFGRHIFSKMLTVEGVSSPEYSLDFKQSDSYLLQNYRSITFTVFSLSFWPSTFSTSCDWKTSSMSAPSVVQLSASWNIINMDSHYLQAWEFQPEISAWNPHDIYTSLAPPCKPTSTTNANRNHPLSKLPLPMSVQ